MTNAVVHWQILTSDPVRTSEFYSGLFDWSVSSANGLGYRAVTASENRGINGGIWPVPLGTPETVQFYVEVDDIEQTLQRVTELGGRVLMPKQVLPDGDAMALAVDPMGRSFGLMTAAPAK